PDGCCLVGLDFDACIGVDGNLDPRQKKRVKKLNTYTEYSPSGTGLHCIGRSSEPVTIGKTDGVEAYSKGRYFTFTGHGKGQIRDATAEILAVVADAKAVAAKAGKQNGQSGEPARHKVADAFKHIDPNEGIGEGIKQDYWFNQLKPEQK